MQAGQRMVAPDGYEIMLFPLPYMYISQGEGGSTSHTGTLNIDFIGWGANGRIYDAPLYAPCSCRCVGTYDPSNNGRIFTSLNPVHCADGVLRTVTFMCYHDENPIASVGDIFTQGDIFAHTGTAGWVTGDHTHFNTAEGTYQGFVNVPPDNHNQLKNSAHIYDICYVNNTVLVVDYGYPWKTYEYPIGYSRKGRFPWVLYARKLRDKYM